MPTAAAQEDRTGCPGARVRRAGRSGRRRVLAAGAALLLVLVATWGIGLARLASDVDDYGDYWAVPRGDPGGLLYVALGDSAAQGVGASRPERGYVALVAGRLRRDTARPVLVVNLSRSGATVRDVADEQLPALRRLRPDLVTVAVGGNDVRSYDAARFRREVEELTAGLPPGALVADVPYFMHGRWEQRARQAAATVSAAAKAHGLPVVPLHAALEDGGNAAMLTDFAADGFHPNDAGHQRWAAAVWAEVQRSWRPPAAAVSAAGRSSAPR